MSIDFEQSLNSLQVSESKKQLFRAVAYDLNDEQCEELIRRVEQMKLAGVPLAERDQFIEQYVKSIKADNSTPPLVYGACENRYETLEDAAISYETKDAIQQLLDAEAKRISAKPVDIAEMIDRSVIPEEEKTMLRVAVGRGPKSALEALDGINISPKLREQLLKAGENRSKATMTKLDTIGKRCKHARRVAGLNLVEAGRKLRLSYRVLEQYERDEVTPSLTRQWIIAQGYNVSDEWLAGKAQEIGTFEFPDIPIGCKSLQEMVLDPGVSFDRDALCDIVDFGQMREHIDFPPDYRITKARERYGYEIDISTLIDHIKQDAAPTAMNVNPIQKYTHDSTKEGESA